RRRPLPERIGGNHAKASEQDEQNDLLCHGIASLLVGWAVPTIPLSFPGSRLGTHYSEAPASSARRPGRCVILPFGEAEPRVIAVPGRTLGPRCIITTSRRRCWLQPIPTPRAAWPTKTAPCRSGRSPSPSRRDAD